MHCFLHTPTHFQPSPPLSRSKFGLVSFLTCSISNGSGLVKLVRSPAVTPKVFTLSAEVVRQSKLKDMPLDSRSARPEF